MQLIFLVILWWDLSITLLFLNSPCSHSIKHITYIRTALSTEKVSNVQDEKKEKNTSKHVQKTPNKNIHRRASEQNIAHAQ